jgi:hypothetical protein
MILIFEQMFSKNRKNVACLVDVACYAQWLFYLLISYPIYYEN